MAGFSRKSPLFSVFFVLLCVSTGAAETASSSPYPLIAHLDIRNTLFRQYLDDVQSARRRSMNRTGISSPESLAEGFTLYSYTVREGDDFFSLAARCSLSHSALATLNRLPHPSSIENSGTILLPSVPGIFIPESPESDLEQLIAASRNGAEAIALTINIKGKQERFLFIPGEDFSQTERAFFLNIGFRFPLRTYRLTSTFGPRINPITGTLKVHEGLDLAAPEGTEVYAARGGIVTDIGEDPLLGTYIIIQHGESWASIYGHLSAVHTVLRSAVQSGILIGRVGSTGQSTGPHLHFELRQHGQAQDPGRFLFRDGLPP
ncbi:M23 family metallopeptidase [Treponema sp. OttesenSCG-928-L16]|nr:M23 family metallopeptidase [Treponema sp. OttesenSCG-928-L16]